MEDNIEPLSAHRKIPVFVFIEHNLITKDNNILFITLEASSLFECIRHYMALMCKALTAKNLVSFSFETRLMSPKEIEGQVNEIAKKKRDLVAPNTQRPAPKPSPKPKLVLLPPIKDFE